MTTELRLAAEKAADFRERQDWAAYRFHCEWARKAFGRVEFRTAESEVAAERQPTADRIRRLTSRW